MKAVIAKMPGVGVLTLPVANDLRVRLILSQSYHIDAYPISNPGGLLRKPRAQKLS